MATYYELGAGLQLNEIVFAGTHDAGITEGAWNAKTQNLDIRGQAFAGVCLFDLRIAGARTQVDGHKQVELRTYHGAPTTKEVNRRVVGLEGVQQNVVRSYMKAGTWGESLQAILVSAKYFVTVESTEFLILKFDKSYNWPQIAELCDQELGNTLYKGTGSLNKKTLFELKGKVIVVVMDEFLSEVPNKFKGAGGIQGIKNLRNGGDYMDDYDGLQYYGKGGTDLTTRTGKVVKENYNKQLGLMQGGAAGDPEVMGMMYWTSTGLVGDIKKRNKMMWKGKNVSKMEELWMSGMGNAVGERIPANVDPTSYAGGPILKRFLPNIIMIDFADTPKCKTIYELNNVIATELTEMEKQAVELEDAL
jgi:hypothetical protein